MNKFPSRLLTIALTLCLVAVAAGLVISHPVQTIAKNAALCGLALSWNEPLFQVADFKPGYNTAATVTVSNTTSEMRALGIEFEPKRTDPNFLASQINITLSRPGKASQIFTLEQLYNKGEFKLSEFDPTDDNVEITFAAEFKQSAGNPYQGKKTEFNVIFGCYGETLGEQTDEGAVLGVVIGLPMTGANLLSSALAASGLLGIGLWLRRRLIGKKELT